MTASVLVSAGEASGDRLAALTLASLRGLGFPTRAFGLGGTACCSVGMDVIVSLSDVAVMGWLPVARRAFALQRAFRALLRASRRREASCAFLVGFTSFNQALGRLLRAREVPVLWCVAPQVWAWRPSRLETLRRSVDCLAVVLPFEEPLWKEAGYDVHYVGHPAVELTRMGSAPSRPCLALLPGSRDQEVRSTAQPFLRAAERWRDAHPEWGVEVVVSPAISPGCEAWLGRKARAHGMGRRMADPMSGAAPHLHRYSLALCASGTACLEAALAGVPPVIGYRCDPFSAFLARRFLLTDRIGLPNILLGEDAFPEILQGNLRPDRIVDGLTCLHANPEAQSACRRLRSVLEIDDDQTFGSRMARLLVELIPDSSRRRTTLPRRRRAIRAAR